MIDFMIFFSFIMIISISTVIGIGLLKKGDIITLEDHFKSKDEFNKDSIDDSKELLSYNIFDIGKGLMSIGYNNMDLIEEYASKPNKIPDKDIERLNDYFRRNHIDPETNYRVLDVEDIDRSRIQKDQKEEIYGQSEFIKALEDRDALDIINALPEKKKEEYKRPVNIEEFTDKDIVYIGTTEDSAAWKNKEKGVYGATDTRFTYFTPDRDLAISHGDGILLEIDSKELARYREIYRDPEASYNTSEENKTFVVMGGIPYKAIKNKATLKELI